MKKLLLAAAGLMMTLAVAAQSLPKTQIKDLNTGKKVEFNSIVTSGRVTVISFWATWCIPCKKEIKNISAVLPNWKKEVDFDYVTVSIDEARAEGIARTYAVSQGWTFPYYIDPNSDLKRSLNFQNVPFINIANTQAATVGGGSQQSNLQASGQPNPQELEAQKQKTVDAIIAAITSSVRPEIWKQNGGAASIWFFNGNLIITAPRSVQAAIGGK